MAHVCTGRCPATRFAQTTAARNENGLIQGFDDTNGNDTPTKDTGGANDRVGPMPAPVSCRPAIVGRPIRLTQPHSKSGLADVRMDTTGMNGRHGRITQHWNYPSQSILRTEHEIQPLDMVNSTLYGTVNAQSVR
jgi:hypothetical protein